MLCGTHLARQDVSKGRESVVQSLVVNGLVQVFDEDVSHARATKSRVSLRPHDATGRTLDRVKVESV